MLTVLGPLFIGSGKKLQKSEYVYDIKSRFVYVMDTFKLYQGLKQRRLFDAFNNHVMTSAGKFNLDDFFKEKEVKVWEYKEWAKYKYPFGGKAFIKKTEIFTCIKDPYNMPYVPGSSLKGAIRNAVLNALIYDSDNFSDVADEVYNEKFEKRTRYLSKPAKELNLRLFNTLERLKEKRDSALNDIFYGLRIGDSKPLEPNVIALSQKIDVFAGKNSDNNRKLNIHRECIAPGTTLEFPLEIDIEIFPYDADRLCEFIEKMYNIQQKHFLSHFPSADEQSGALLYLGGGTGFVSKTAVYSLYSNDEKRRLSIAAKILDNMDSYKQGKREKIGDHINDPKKYHVAPHMRKCTDYKGMRYDFGLCKVEFQPIP